MWVMKSVETLGSDILIPRLGGAMTWKEGGPDFGFLPVAASLFKA